MEQKKKRKTLYELFFKRFFDIVLSLLALIILSPLFLIVAIVSKIVLKGNVIFAQYRPGRNGKIFKLYKFRSMTNAVDKDGNPLPDEQRITKWGKFIRKLSIDELPQLWNILKGDMSIVGPRPRLVKDMVFYDQEVLKAYSVRPGLTGPAQVGGARDAASWEEIFKIEYDYAQRITFWGDVKIIFKTIGFVFKSNTSYAGNIKRDYYYSDYLLRTNQISKEQYEKGLNEAEKIILEKGIIKYNSELRKGDNENDRKQDQ